MQSSCGYASAVGFALLLGSPALAQNCYQSHSNCFTFGPPEGGEAAKFNTENLLQLRSQRLTIEGDLRLRVRSGDAPNSEVYNGRADQQAFRGRLRARFQATEQISALAEYNFSETWGGSESYSDALAGENFNKMAQFYVAAENLFGFGDRWRIGRSEYILGNGLILGSCDFLQRPGTFTGAWFAHSLQEHQFELFVFDDRGPLQALHPAVRYTGGTADFVLGKHTREWIGHVKPYVLVGTSSGDEFTTPPANPTEEDLWIGLDVSGTLPCGFAWFGEVANRDVNDAEDRLAWRATLTKELEWFDGVVKDASLRVTDAEGKMDVGNPADFNSAGLLHQYGGAWRSDLQTTQLSARLRPGLDLTVDLTLMSLNARDAAVQLGKRELNVVVGRPFPSGIYASIGYGIDNDRRQVGYGALTLNF